MSGFSVAWLVTRNRESPSTVASGGFTRCSPRHDSMPDDPEDDGRRFADLVSEPDDVPKLREHIKSLAKDARDRGEDASVDDFLAQSRKNDAAYIAPVDLEKAEWIAEIYEKEGRPETHPRNFHNQILGKGYERRNGEPYTASNSSWAELKEAFKWARIIGLIDSSRIEDAANPDPKPTAFDDVERPLPQSGERTTQDATFGIDVDDGFRPASTPTKSNWRKPCSTTPTSSSRRPPR